MNNRRKILFSVLCILFVVQSARGEPPGRWPEERAQRWAKERGWLVGCNFIPSTAINQLEMWQAESFDPETIDRELGWAEALGFNSVRVFMHHLLWQDDAQGFLGRLEKFLAIAEKHRIGVMFVLFDSCWDPYPKLGKQREPKPRVHNSGWMQSPGYEVLKDPAKQDVLKPYVLGVVGHFRNDVRIHAWDVWNEPSNGDGAWHGEEKIKRVQPLLAKAFAWTREAEPTQPLTAGVWMGPWDDLDKLHPIERFQLDQSDIVSFHIYKPLKEVKPLVEKLRRYGRPILCTEYMARTEGSTFDPILGYFRRQGVGAYNWGFVSGKTQTIYPWDSWQKKYDGQPPRWFHDVLRKDGTPYDPRETEYIRSVTQPQKSDNKLNLLWEGDYFKVRSQASNKTILRSDPKYKLIERLIEVGKQSKNYPKTSLGKYKIAPVHRLYIYRIGKNVPDQLVARLDHYSPERMIWTEEYGFRRLSKDREKEMVELWRSIRQDPDGQGPPETNN